MANNQVKIYCGTKSILPDGYGRFGTRYECMQCGFGSALMQYKWAPASNDPRPPARKKRGCYRPRNPKESRSSERTRKPVAVEKAKKAIQPVAEKAKKAIQPVAVEKAKKAIQPVAVEKAKKAIQPVAVRKRRKRSSRSPSRKRRKRSSPSRSQINRWIKEELRRSRRKPCKRGQIRDRSSKRCRRKKCYPKVRDRKSKRCRSPRRRRSRGASEEKKNN